ncbi:MAG TPA: hypothetical protein VI258_10860 [Rhodanobacteraceae bacterium]
MAFRRGLAPIVIAIAVALVYWPGLDGFWTRDDFMQLAFARLVGSPWAVFLHDHYFPAPGSIFRPLGFASFWLSQALFGPDYFWNAFGDLVLHVAVSVALYRAIRAGAVERVPAVLCALLFALQPAVLGTALWWSARFDLLALLFGLVAIRAALDFEARPRLGSMLLALAAVLAALLSKETALAAAAAVGLVWLRSGRSERSKRSAMLRAITFLGATIALFFAWRTAVLGTLTTGLAGDASIVDAIARGLVAWCAHLPDYLTFGARSGIVVAIVLALYLAFELARLTLVRAQPGAPASARVGVAISGICLFVLPAILQAPIAAMNAQPLHADASAVEAAMQSRLYYFSIGGLAMLLAAGLGRVGSSTKIPHAALGVTLAVGVALFGWKSRELATGFAVTAAAARPIAERVSAAVDRAAQGAATACRIVVLGVQPPPEWSVYVSIDSVAKALTSDIDRVGRCFVEADYVTYFNLMRGDPTPASASPYLPRSANGRPIPWLRIGDMTSAYLDPPTNADAAQLAGIVFLRYENGALVDVTGDVATGRTSAALR